MHLRLPRLLPGRGIHREVLRPGNHPRGQPAGCRRRDHVSAGIGLLFALSRALRAWLIPDLRDAWADWPVWVMIAVLLVADDITQDDGIGLYQGHHGNLLLLWDILFGTSRITRQYPPACGLNDDRRHGQETWYHQLFFPLVKSRQAETV